MGWVVKRYLLQRTYVVSRRLCLVFAKININEVFVERQKGTSVMLGGRTNLFRTNIHEAGWRLNYILLSPTKTNCLSLFYVILFYFRKINCFGVDHMQRVVLLSESEEDCRQRWLHCTSNQGDQISFRRKSYKMYLFFCQNLCITLTLEKRSQNCGLLL
jgi:hypothetical protein